MSNIKARGAGWLYFWLTMMAALALNIGVVACGESSPTVNSTNTVSPKGTSTIAVATTTSGSMATATPVIIATAALNSATSILASTQNSTNPVATTLTTPTLATTPTPSLTTIVSTNVAQTPVPTVTFAPAPSGYTGKLSIVGNDNAIYVLNLDGKRPPQAVLGKAGQLVDKSNDGELFFWPTWSHDGSKLAAFGVNVTNGAASSSDTFVVKADGSGLYKLQDQSQNQPIYLNWSPDGNFLSILLNKNNSLELNIADTSQNATGKPATLRQVVAGGPIYSQWAADSDGLLVRSGDGNTVPNSVGVFHARSAGATLNPISAEPGNFREPAFSPDGQKIAFSTITTNSTSETINLQNKDGAKLATIPLDGSSAVFNFSPDGSKIASSYMVSNTSTYNGIFINDISQATKGIVLKPTQVVSETVVAFWWSPDGKKLAYIGGNDSGDALTWNIYDIGSKKSTRLTEWIPSREDVQLITYFDQYAASDSIWSPDSAHLVFSGYAGVYLRANGGQPAGDPLTYVLTLNGPNTGKPIAIEPGKLAFWSK